METLMLTIDLAALVVLLFYSVQNERRPDGSAELGPFAIKKFAPPEAPPPGPPARTYRRARTR